MSPDLGNADRSRKCLRYAIVQLINRTWIRGRRARLARTSPRTLLLTCLLAICVFLGFLSVFAGKNLQHIVSHVVSQGGIPAYFLALVIIHVLILPVLPDPLVALAPILFPNSYWLVLVLSAFAPILAASIDLYLGRHYGRSLLLKIGSEKIVKTGEELAGRYGAYGVLLSGILPLNFSLLCWFCGILRVSPVRAILAVVATRVPRYALVYVFGSDLIRKLVHWI